MIFGCGRIDDGGHTGDPVGGKAAATGGLAHELLTGGVIDATDLVVGDKASDPLHVGSHVAHHAAGLLRNGVEIGWADLAGPAT
ncbi:hypothetical protein NK718_21480 [Alsobacter sp. SYSU M60028]|uniref:Uncharacterized protein n=1 Tax=Alsobacter ponti TaxID=2962936 RepID=A0ABT1LHW6_9HYPH|nr:hypothetical protein [Alsobacter ponti]MCP8941101.1 hypothetical protein [Alsobacter ponti]